MGEVQRTLSPIYHALHPVWVTTRLRPDYPNSESNLRADSGSSCTSGLGLACGVWPVSWPRKSRISSASSVA